MKNLIILATLILFGLTATISAQDKPKEEKTLKQETFEVKGMTCQSCVKAVETKLGKIDGVKKYDVSLEAGEAVVEYDPNKVNTEKIEKEFEKSPYKVTGEEKETRHNKQKE